MSLVPGTRRCAWRGDFSSSHSLGIVNDGLVGALERAGVEVTRLAPNARPAAEDVVGAAAHWPPSWEPVSDGPFAIYQPWEFGEIPAAWAEEIRTRVDEVWTASEYSRRSYLAGGVAPELVHVVPNGVDLELFAPDGPAHALPARRGTVFLFVGGTTWRKGIDVLLDAWGRAFDAGDDVLLAIKGFGGDSFYRGQTADDAIEQLRARPGTAPVVRVDERLSRAALAALYRAADCLVQPYRGEGFCLPVLEALACGVPAIATAGGPTDEFAPETCAWRLPAVPVPVPAAALRGFEPRGGGCVLEPDADALVDLLRTAAAPDARAAKAAAARAAAERCSWDAAAAAVVTRLDALAGRAPVRALRPAVVPDARRLVVAVDADWADEATWAPALDAYAAAFGPDDAVTLVLPAADERLALACVTARLGEAALERLADVVLADPAATPAAALELGADAFVATPARRPLRARRVVAPDPVSLRALLDS